MGTISRFNQVEMYPVKTDTHDLLLPDLFLIRPPMIMEVILLPSQNQEKVCHVLLYQVVERCLHPSSCPLCRDDWWRLTLTVAMRSQATLGHKSHGYREVQQNKPPSLFGQPTLKAIAIVELSWDGVRRGDGVAERGREFLLETGHCRCCGARPDGSPQALLVSNLSLFS